MMSQKTNIITLSWHLYFEMIMNAVLDKDSLHHAMEINKS